MHKLFLALFSSFVCLLAFRLCCIVAISLFVRARKLPQQMFTIIKNLIKLWQNSANAAKLVSKLLKFLQDFLIILLVPAAASSLKLLISLV